MVAEELKNEVVVSTNEEVSQYADYVAQWLEYTPTPKLLQFSEWQAQREALAKREMQEAKCEELAGKMQEIMQEMEKWGLYLETVGESGHFAHRVFTFEFNIK